MLRLGVDTGGTFTDFVCWDGEQIRIHKQLSTPHAPEEAILQGIAAMGLEPGQFHLVHGSTVATNAALEGKGVRTAYVTNVGFADVLTLGRQARPELYHLQLPPQQPPVPPELCFEVDCRVDATGQRVSALSEASLAQVINNLEVAKPEAVAINLLFSFLDEQDEIAIEQAIRAALPGVFVSRSSAVLPEYREFERGIATWLNSWLGPLVQGYLQRLAAGVSPSPLAVMQSTGGSVAAQQAASKAVNLLLSGPAGGLMAAGYLAEVCQQSQVLTFDMGGTSTDVALVKGRPALTTEGQIGPYPVAVPMVDMHTIGAGGGSIAWIDDGGLLQVGPQSAGASPGPACYGNGGVEPTVTDANLLLGRLRADAFLGGGMSLDVAAAEAAIKRVAESLGVDVQAAAEGILQIANEHMAQALRVISVQQGHDPRDDALMAFGGAAGLHVCDLAEALDMNRAVVPVHGGVLSALGMLVAPQTRDCSRSLRRPLEAGSPDSVSACELDELRDVLSIPAAQELANEGVAMSAIEREGSVDLRYQGQSHCLNIPLPQPLDLAAAAEAFHAEHEQRYGHALAQPIELVNLRVSLRANRSQSLALPALNKSTPAEPLATVALYGMGPAVPVFQRAELAAGQQLLGPALVVEQVSTSLIKSGWSATLDKFGNLMLYKQ